ncbi:MAG TPA: Ger(x)C family spore germination protein [Clostridiaceae bacterium]
MKRKLSLLIILLILFSLFSGCKDSTEIDENVYTIVIGLDKGSNDNIVLTIQYPQFKSSSKVTSGSSSNTSVDSIETSSILSGIDEFNMAISRNVSLKHTKLIVFSEELAREGIGKYLAPLARFREARRSMFVAVSNGKAVDFINENRSSISENITKSVELMLSQAKGTSYFPFIIFHTFYKNMLSPYGETIAMYIGVNNLSGLAIGKADIPHSALETDIKPGELPRTGGVKREYVGTAVFRGDKMVGYLNPYETRYMSMITGSFEKALLTIVDKKSPGDVIPLDVRLGRKPKISGFFNKGTPIINIKLNMEADIGAIQSRINYEDPGMIEDLNNQIKTYLETEIKKMLTKTQEEFKSDVFEFGTIFAAYFGTIQEFEGYDWLKHYPDAKINLDLTVSIRRTGLIIHSFPVLGTPKTK